MLLIKEKDIWVLYDVSYLYNGSQPPMWSSVILASSLPGGVLPHCTRAGLRGPRNVAEVMKYDLQSQQCRCPFHMAPSQITHLRRGRLKYGEDTQVAHGKEV